MILFELASLFVHSVDRLELKFDFKWARDKEKEEDDEEEEENSGFKFESNFRISFVVSTIWSLLLFVVVVVETIIRLTLMPWPLVS